MNPKAVKTPTKMAMPRYLPRVSPVYVYGVAVADDMQPGLEGSQMGLYIGVDKNYAAGTFFSGLIDDIRIYNRAVIP